MRFRLPVLAAALALAASPVHGQRLTYWNFNSNPADGNVTTGTLTPAVGAGTASAIGGVTGSFVSGVADTGSTDTGSVGDNSAFSSVTYPTQGAASGTAGFQFLAGTTGFSDIIARFDIRLSATASRYFRLDYTTDGSTFTPGPVFDQNISVGGTPWYNGRTVDLSGVAAANNNASFGIRVVSVFVPSTSAYAATGGGTYSSAGTARVDGVTISAGRRFVGGSGTSLGTAANYATGGAPATTDTVLLGNSAGANTTVTVDAAATLDQLLFQASAPAFTVGGTGPLALTAGLVNNATTVQTVTAPLTFGNQNTVTSAGDLRLTGGGSFANGLSIQGPGATTLGGTFASTGGSAVTVAPGATLAGGATLPGAVNVRPGGTLSVTTATGPATLSTNTVSFNPTSAAGAVFRVQVTGNVTTQAVNSGASGTPGVNNSQILSNGGITFRGDTLLVVDLTGINYASGVGQTYSFQIGTATSGSNVVVGGGTTFGTFQFLDNGVDITSQITGATAQLQGSGVYLNFTPVPEPATVLAVAAVGLGGLRFARRRLTASSRRPA